ncbi:MAG: SMP-30/gluconolactonase/LRE family protein [Vicinamibacterales bacterium]|jgi:gluconolactonase|nr:SMP-30/gluconolactonase/LRE family protein [Vicinamibacterales bacterium]RUA03004.1 MAG: SMP-30/gluconolactonase/LRE family protein [Candidatus Neomarinimicrobiota bacterium]
MVHDHDQHDQRDQRVGGTSAWTRRAFLGAAIAGSVAAPVWARQQAPQIPPYEPRDWSGQDPVTYPDRDIIALDPRFRRYVLFNTPIKRLHIGTLWAEGPAWNGVGRYLVWSDIPNNVQLRWIQDDGRVTVFRSPSGHSNGNTFDHEGRQISCEHGGRRVARYEQNGDVTVIADRFAGKRLNSPNDAVVHPDGSIWFTDPPYGIRGDYEGFRADSETPPAVYRVDPQSGQVALVSDEPGGPNGLCFSPDYTKLYVADTGRGREIRVWDVDGTSLRNGRRHAALRAPGTDTPVAADGVRCDVDGNVWAGAGEGVLIVAPDGDTIGAIRLPERCANVCFGGTRRNRLFMTASQSLYSVYVGVLGAGIA